MRRAGWAVGCVLLWIAAASLALLSTCGIFAAAILTADGMTSASTLQTTPTSSKTPPTTKAPAKTPTTKAAPTTTTTTLPTTYKTIPKWVAVAQTVLAATDSTGKVSGTPVVFTQIAANGTKPVTVKAPMSESGLRNLLGLKKPPVVNGQAVWNLDLNGSVQNERTISHFPTKSLPLTVSATYELNGKKMSASEIVGKSGLLKVTYTVQNVTNKATKVTIKSIFGNKVTITTHVPIPIAAIVGVTFPSSFTNLRTPNAGTVGYGNGTTAASWTLFTFKPLGDLKQYATYEAQVTNASVPSATVEAEVVPPQELQSLPTISEPGAPTAPTVTVGVKLAGIQLQIRKQLKTISAAASKVLAEFKAVAVPAAVQVSGGGAKTATALAKIATDATLLSIQAHTISNDIARRAANASILAATIATAQSNLTALPAAICSALSTTKIPVTAACPSTVEARPIYRALQRGLTTLETVVTDLVNGLTTASTDTQTLATTLATTVANDLTTASTDANTFSRQALALSNTLAVATLAPSKKQPKTVQPTQVSGHGRLDAAVAELNDSITQAGNSVDASYAQLDALDIRAAQNQMPAGNATGATMQNGLVIFSVSGANQTQHQIHLSIIIGITALSLGATIGLGLYRIRKGWASSLAPTKKS